MHDNHREYKKPWLYDLSRLEGLDLLIRQDLEKQAELIREDSSTMSSTTPPYADPYH